MSERVTLQTIADRVGVSRATVSYAYSRPDQVSEHTRKRILEVAGELGYPGPDPAARRLRRGTAGSLGLLFTETLRYAFDDPYAVGFLKGLACSVEEAGRGLLLLPAPPDTEVAAVGDAVVDGFCIFSLPRGHPALPALLGRKVPLVFVDMPYVPGFPFIGIDERLAGWTITDHVLGLGHRRIAVLSTRLHYDDYTGWADIERQDTATFEDFRQRLAGYRDAVESAGLDWARVPVFEIAQNTRDRARDAARILLSRTPRPTAILALSDVAAVAVLDVAGELGLTVPGDLTVTGFSGVPDAEAAGLTTIGQPMDEIGKLAGKILLGKKDADADRIILPHELIIRRSSGAPA